MVFKGTFFTDFFALVFFLMMWNAFREAQGKRAVFFPPFFSLTHFCTVFSGLARLLARLILVQRFRSGARDYKHSPLPLVHQLLEPNYWSGISDLSHHLMIWSFQQVRAPLFVCFFNFYSRITEKRRTRRPFQFQHVAWNSADPPLDLWGLFILEGVWFTSTQSIKKKKNKCT